MRAIIFDLDGTLLDTIEDISDSMNHVLDMHDFPRHTIEEYKLFVGDGASNLVKRSVRSFDAAEEILAQLEQEFRVDYDKRQTTKTRPYDGIPELLSELVDRGIKIAVLSNKPHELTEKIIAHYFPDVIFNAVIGQRPGHPIKPDPAVALEILEIFGLRSNDVLYVGDTGTDMLTAKAADLTAVGALWGFRDKDELAENGADFFAKRPIDIIKRWFGGNNDG